MNNESTPQINAESAKARAMYRALNRNSKLWLFAGAAAIAFEAFVVMKMSRVSDKN